MRRSLSGRAAALILAAPLAATLMLAGPACSLDASGKTACRTARDCLDGFQCIDQVCTRGDGSRADASDGNPGADAGDPPDSGPSFDAPVGCAFGPGEDGCVCGFREQAPSREWPGYEADCDDTGDFCRADCCPDGQRINAEDPTSCIPDPDLPPELRYFGPWPDRNDEASQMRLNWIVYGADSCTVTLSIDGGEPIVEEHLAVDLIAIDKLAAAVDESALAASLDCQNEFGRVTQEYSIPAAAERVAVAGLGAGFPQPVRICWQVLPFFTTDLPPYAGGVCSVGLCPAGVDFDPSSSEPCLEPAATQPFSTATGCIDTEVAAGIGDRAYVACENANVQRAVHDRIIQSIARPTEGASP